MQISEQVFWLIVAAIVLAFVFKIARWGGVKASMFNAEIKSTVGEVETIRATLMSQRIKIHRLLRDGAPLIGIEVVSKSAGSYDMLPLTLNEEQARQLTALLTEAQKPQ